MSEKNVVSNRDESAPTTQELPFSAEHVKRLGSDVLSRSLDIVGISLWWESLHVSIGMTPNELLEIDPGAALDYVNRWKIQ